MVVLYCSMASLKNVVDEGMPIQRIVDNKGENEDQQTENEITLFR